MPGDVTRDVERLELEHHVDREALVAQLRALSSAVEHLAQAVELVAGERIEGAVDDHLDDARWSLKAIW